MRNFRDIERFLPQYLSKDAQETLFKELKDFPDNIDDRIYTGFLAHEPNIYQGDGLDSIPGVNLPRADILQLNGVVLSNTCDLDPANIRLQEPRLVYATVIKLQKYYDMLIRVLVDSQKRTRQEIDRHIENVKKQQISHMFYLPRCESLGEESIALFDRINNISISQINPDELPRKRLFSLSDYGFYLFLYKLSIHFTRIREGIDRGSPVAE